MANIRGGFLNARRRFAIRRGLAENMPHPANRQILLSLACEHRGFYPVRVLRESQAAKAARAKKIIAGLRETYPDAHCELNFSNPLELLIATILSAQCTDKRVNLVTADLFKKYRSAADYAQAQSAELEREIRTAGFFRSKTKSIKACCQALLERHAGSVPRTMAELTNLGGVGRKTANV